MKVAIPILLFVLLFFLFTYNSGYGYDALEYLCIGDSLYKGQTYLSIIPSKGPLFYYLIALYHFIFQQINHLELSLIITFHLVLAIGAFWLLVQQQRGNNLLAGLTFLIILAFFTEMNFLEPEILVYVHLLLGLVFYSRYLHTKHSYNLFFLGLFLGFGFLYKQIAVYYLPAFYLFLLSFSEWRISFFRMMIVSVAFSIPLGVFALIEFSQGKLVEFWNWFFIYPAFYYPANAEFLSKSLLKLLPFHVIFIAFLFRSIQVALIQRQPILNHPTTHFLHLSVMLALCGLYPCLKSQASHFFFPAYACLALSIYYSKATFSGSAINVLRAGFAIIALFLIAIIYRPDALKRFIKLNDYRQETDYMARFSPIKKWNFDYMIDFTSGSMSRQYPFSPKGYFKFIHTDVQTVYYLQTASITNTVEPEDTFVVIRPTNKSITDFNASEMNECASCLDKIALFEQEIKALDTLYIDNLMFTLNRLK